MCFLMEPQQKGSGQTAKKMAKWSTSKHTEISTKVSGQWKKDMAEAHKPGPQEMSTTETGSKISGPEPGNTYLLTGLFRMEDSTTTNSWDDEK